jgi:hypothetical protein
VWLERRVPDASPYQIRHLVCAGPGLWGDWRPASDASFGITIPPQGLSVVELVPPRGLGLASEGVTGRRVATERRVNSQSDGIAKQFQWKRSSCDAPAGGLLGNDRGDTKGRFEHEHEHEHEGNSRLLHRGCEHKTDGLCTAGAIVLTRIRFPPHPPVSHSAPARGTRSTCPGIESGDGNSVQGASFRLVGA